MIDDNELWLLSYYRVSEMAGAVFFGRVAQLLGPRACAFDLTRHFAEEAQHAWYWTRCIEELGAKPIALPHAYQDGYAAAGGLPTNLMEVLAATQVFERRAISQYARHGRRAHLNPVVAETLATILADERGHLAWVKAALADMAPRYGEARIRAAVARFQAADRQVRCYQELLQRHAEDLFKVESRSYERISPVS